MAKLAGIPAAVLERARYLQAELEAKERSLPREPQPRGEAAARPAAPATAAVAGELFNPGELVLAELASIDIDRLTPLEALNRLSALKKRLRP